MKYKEFVAWCNNRACDGQWSMATAVHCISIMREIRNLPFWKREKEWQKIAPSMKKILLPSEDAEG